MILTFNNFFCLKNIKKNSYDSYLKKRKKKSKYEIKMQQEKFCNQLINKNMYNLRFLSGKLLNILYFLAFIIKHIFSLQNN